MTSSRHDQGDRSGHQDDHAGRPAEAGSPGRRVGGRRVRPEPLVSRRRARQRVLPRSRRRPAHVAARHGRADRGGAEGLDLPRPGDRRRDPLRHARRHPHHEPAHPGRHQRRVPRVRVHADRPGGGRRLDDQPPRRTARGPRAGSVAVVLVHEVRRPLHADAEGLPGRSAGDPHDLGQPERRHAARRRHAVLQGPALHRRQRQRVDPDQHVPPDGVGEVHRRHGRWSRRSPAHARRLPLRQRRRQAREGWRLGPDPGARRQRPDPAAAARLRRAGHPGHPARGHGRPPGRG